MNVSVDIWQDVYNLIRICNLFKAYDVFPPLFSYDGRMTSADGNPPDCKQPRLRWVFFLLRVHIQPPWEGAGVGGGVVQRLGPERGGGLSWATETETADSGVTLLPLSLRSLSGKEGGRWKSILLHGAGEEEGSPGKGSQLCNKGCLTPRSCSPRTQEAALPDGEPPIWESVKGS